MADTQKVKITINIDQHSLTLLRGKAKKTGIPYQRLINQILGASIKNERETETRLEKLEREFSELKRKLAA